MNCSHHALLAIAALGGLASVAAIGIQGCLACNDAICNSRLSLGVTERDGGPLAPGSWSFELVVDDGEPRVATCTIGQASRSARCDGDFVIWPMIFDHPDNPYTRFQIDFEGGDGLHGLPRHLVITIAHDHYVVLEEPLEPRYELAEPERCDPDCFHDHITMVVERP